MRDFLLGLAATAVLVALLRQVRKVAYDDGYAMGYADCTIAALDNEAGRPLGLGLGQELIDELESWLREGA